MAVLLLLVVWFFLKLRLIVFTLDENKLIKERGRMMHFTDSDLFPS